MIHVHPDRWRWLAAAVLIAAVVVTYWPGLHGPFVFDDHGNILRNPSVKMKALTWPAIREAAYSGILNPDALHRPLARVTFALNYFFAQTSFRSFDFKVTNLLIHLFNGVLVWCLVSLLCSQLRRSGRITEAGSKSTSIWRWFPLLVTALWLLHPIQLTSVLYVVQRMTSLAGTGVLIGVILFAYGRFKHDEGSRAGLWIVTFGVAFGTVLGVSSKENAALTPLFALLVELFFFDRQALEAKARHQLKLLYGGVFLVFAIAMVAMVVLRFDVLINFYDVRNFTVWDRLLTQPRALFSYLQLIFVPQLRDFSLFHDDLVISTGLMTPPTTLLALFGLAALFAYAVFSIRRRSLIGFAILWYLIGHSIESGIVGLELVHEHRNYIPSFGPIFAAAFYAFIFIDRFARARVLAMLGTVVLLTIAFVTHTRASIWSSVDDIVYASVRNHPQSYRTRMALGGLLQLRNRGIDEIYDTFREAARLNEFNILPVARMERILWGLINQIEEGSLREDPATDLVPTAFDSPLVVELDYLRALEKLTDEEFRHRLRSFAFDAESILAFDELRQCVGSRFLTCPPPETVEQWGDIALARDHLIADQRVAISILMARFHSYRGNLDAAVALLETAIQASPTDVSVHLQLALIYARFGELEKAKQVVNGIAPLVEATGRRQRDFHSLNSQIDELLNADDELFDEDFDLDALN